MDHIVQAIHEAHQRLLMSLGTYLEAAEASGDVTTERKARALNAYWENLNALYATCDRAQEFVESVRQRIGSECMVDEATGPVSAKLAAENGGKLPGAVAPLSAVRLEQLSKAVRWLVIELQHGAQPGGSNAGGSVVTSDDA